MSKQLTILKTIIMEKKFFYLSLLFWLFLGVAIVVSHHHYSQDKATPTPEKQTITGTIERMGLVLDVHFYVLKEYPGVEFRAVHEYTPEVTYLKEGDVVKVTYHQAEGYQFTDELDIINFDI